MWWIFSGSISTLLRSTGVGHPGLLYHSGTGTIHKKLHYQNTRREEKGSPESICWKNSMIKDSTEVTKLLDLELISCNVCLLKKSWCVISLTNSSCWKSEAWHLLQIRLLDFYEWQGLLSLCQQDSGMVFQMVQKHLFFTLFFLWWIFHLYPKHYWNRLSLSSLLSSKYNK